MRFAQRDNRLTESRLTFLEWGIAALFLVLISGFWQLQIFEPAYYTRLAERNHIKSLSIPSPRGRILDRYNRVLVDNQPSFSIVSQWEVGQSLQVHLPAIAKGLDQDPEQLTERVKMARAKVPRQAIVVQKNATLRDIAFVESHRVEFPELDLVSEQQRLYPRAGFAAHLFGYISEVSERQLAAPEMALLKPGDMIGKSGIERQYDSVLRGQDGVRRVIVNNRGGEMELLDEEFSTAGRDLRLTIDYDLQEVAEQNFQGEKGALVALDPRTGEILALMSRPAFDLNLFARGIPIEEWQGLVADSNNPFLNRAIQAQLAPGSIYKILLATAGLEVGAVDETTTHYCRGGGTFYGRYFRCWKSGGHGRVAIHQAIAHSCDVFFYNLGKDMGIDLMHEYSTRLGLGQRTGIDLPNEQPGNMPSAQWKQRVFRERWYPGETISLAIGQGALTTTPLQLAYSIGGIASGGHFARPHLVSWPDMEAHGLEIPSPTHFQVPLREETVKLVTDGLYGVVNEGGTGVRARIKGLDVGGKTGTAQVASLEMVAASENADALKDNAWFVGLAPRRNPEIVVVALYEGGEHGYLAAPVVREVIKTYFDKKEDSGFQYAQTPDASKDLASGQFAPEPGG